MTLPQLNGVRNLDPTLSVDRVLPPEILYEIFTYLRSTTELSTNPYHGNKKVRNQIFSLTWVCSLWRALILTRNTFWTSFDIELSSVILGPDMAEVCAFFIECVSRSGDAPLSLALTHGDLSLLTGPYPALDALLDKASHWQAVDFMLWSGGDRSAMQYITHRLGTSTQFTRLHRLKTVKRTHFGSDFLRMFQGCTSLQKVDAFALRRSDSICLSRITTLKILDYFGSSFAELLERCPLLETLSLYAVEVEEDGDESDVDGLPSDVVSESRVYHHTHLSQVTLYIDNKKYPASSWQLIALPALTEIWIQVPPTPGAGGNHWEDSRESVDGFRDMLVRSRCVLQKVTLVEFESPRQTASEFLEGISSVVAADAQVGFDEEKDYPDSD